MKKVLLIVFSGTNNTLEVAKMIKNNFTNFNIETNIYNIKKPFTIKNIEEYDLIGFGYPIYAFNAPKIVIDFVKTLDKIENKKAFIFKTSGEPFYFNRSSSHLLMKKLKKLGYNIMSETQFLMPYNILFRYKDNLVKQMYLSSESLSKILVNDLINNKISKVHYSILNIIVSFILRIQYFGASINGMFYKVKKKKCINCNKCIHDCPTNNIYRKKDKIKFSSKCIMCMRCSMLCPTNAINIGLINPFKINGAYKFKQIVSNNSLDGKFINPNTKGFFKYFRKYYKTLDNKILQAKKDNIIN